MIRHHNSSLAKTLILSQVCILISWFPRKSYSLLTYSTKQKLAHNHERGDAYFHRATACCSYVLCLDGRGFVLQVTKSNWQPSFDAKLHRRSQQCKVWKYFTAFLFAFFDIYSFCQNFLKMCEKDYLFIIMRFFKVHLPRSLVEEKLSQSA